MKRKCPICERTFRTARGLGVHTARVHGPNADVPSGKPRPPREAKPDGPSRRDRRSDGLDVDGATIAGKVIEALETLEALEALGLRVVVWEADDGSTAIATTLSGRVARIEANGDIVDIVDIVPCGLSFEPC